MASSNLGSHVSYITPNIDQRGSSNHSILKNGNSSKELKQLLTTGRHNRNSTNVRGARLINLYKTSSMQIGQTYTIKAFQAEDQSDNMASTLELEQKQY